MYLIRAKYGSDPERKRIEYIFEKWRSKMNITKPEGITVIADTEDVEEMILELFTRAERKDNITFYRMDEVQLDVERSEKRIRLRLEEKREIVERLLDFIMARQRAILKMELVKPFQKIYEVHSKKGKAEITVGLHETETGVDLSINISGYGEAVGLLYRKLNDEFKLMEEQE
ncbi:MAG: hypothetical protein WBH01_05770 [Dehalococcoidia bacterium]